MDVRSDDEVLDRLTRRARDFVYSFGVRTEPRRLDLAGWVDAGVPSGRALEFQRLWGGLVLPPGPFHDGGPKYFDVVDLVRADTGEWLIEIGPSTTAVPYGFVIGPDGAFGIVATGWVPLHASIEGWIESLALSHDAFTFAQQITRFTNTAVDSVDLAGLDRVEEVEGVTDTWWCGGGVLVACSSGEAEAFDAPQTRQVLRYTGVPDWVPGRGSR
ncbi:hypothetical protein GCM10009830_38070 [Glycomyces endophyticus]|uniref:SMI1/KNR4 family protein n=1 Tax=Glycomyces endophyticus TaxID=480996 RepID=A0ABP4TF03_9ACTN